MIHAADVPVKDKEKRHKSDPRDRRRIARGLRGGELEPIYVPSVTARKNRALVRRRCSLIKEITRGKNRIKSLLDFHGISIPGAYRRRNWSGDFIQRLETVELTTEGGNQSLKSLLRQLSYYRDEEATVSRKIRAQAGTDRYKDAVKYLTSIPGIGIISAMIWLTELVDIGRFQRFDHLSSYVSLVPWERSSGERSGIAAWTAGVSTG